MDSGTALFIRACKSTNPEGRIKRLYKIMYYSDFSSRDMALIMLKIAEKYNIISLTNIVDALNPVNHWKFGIDNSEDYYANVIRIITSYIRITSLSDLPGYPYKKGYY